MVIPRPARGSAVRTPLPLGLPSPLVDDPGSTTGTTAVNKEKTRRVGTMRSLGESGRDTGRREESVKGRCSLSQLLPGDGQT